MPNENLLRLDQQFPWERSPLQPELRRLMGSLEARFSPLEVKVIDWEAAVNQLNDVGLERVNETLGPLLTQLQQAADIGFLVAAASDQTRTLVNEATVQFIITSEGKELFTPTPYVLLQDIADEDNWGIAELQSYLPDTGELSLTVKYTAPGVVAGSDWSVSCNSAVIPIIVEAMESTTADRAAVAADKAAVAADKLFVEEAIGELEGGAVVSVAGRGGIVTLVVADIGGLEAELTAIDAAIAAKASTTYVNTQVASRQAASAKLDAIAGAAWAAGRVMVLTGTATMAPYALSDFVRDSILPGADAAAVKNALGISATNYMPVATKTTSYTAAAADNNSLLIFQSTSAVLTLPNNMPVGWSCAFMFDAASGDLDITPASGATRVSRDARYKLSVRYAVGSAICRTNTTGTNAAYVLAGDLSA